MYVGVCRLVLIAGHCHSLKEKRSVVRKLKDRAQARFNLAITEVGGLDTWQRIVVGFALVGSEAGYVDGTIEKVVRFIDGMGIAEIVDEKRETIRYEGDDGSGDTPEFAVPDEWREEELS